MKSFRYKFDKWHQLPEPKEKWRVPRKLKKRIKKERRGIARKYARDVWAARFARLRQEYEVYRQYAIGSGPQ